MPDAASTHAIQALEEALGSLSYLLTRSQTHDRQAALAGVQLTRSDLHLLSALNSDGGRNDGGNCPAGQRISDLALQLMVEASHVTRQVVRLERQGLAERSHDPNDRRARQVAITDQGREVLSRIHAVNRAGIQEALHDVTAKDITVAADVLRQLVDRYARKVRAEVTQVEPALDSEPVTGH